MVNYKSIKESVPVEKYIKVLQMIVLLVLNPITTFCAFWIVKINDSKLAVLPFLGLGAMTLGGVLGLYFSKLLKHERKQTGSMFVSGSFSNTVSFGGLICFVLFGETSYAFVSMYKLFEEFALYMVGYPIAKLYGNDSEESGKKNALKKVFTDPFILVYFTSITIGIALNLSGVARPLFFQKVNEILIPLAAVLLVTTVGFNMQIKAIGKYMRECFTVASIKFFILPLTITGLAFLTGLGQLNNGLILKIVLVLSSMPPAFNSLIPPQIYGLDVDLVIRHRRADSCAAGIDCCTKLYLTVI
jgi:predicted permease